jgi:seryl-tRNA synthetase
MAEITTQKSRRGIQSVEGEIIKQGPVVDGARRFSKTAVLFECGLVAEFVKGSGQYVLLPKGTRMIRVISALLTRDIGAELGFEEVILPKIAPLSTFRKADILDRWDEYLMAVVPYASTKGVSDSYIFDPLQCTAFYQFIEGREITADNLPMKWFDRSGPSYRNEDSDRFEPLVRQREFHRFEFVYIGTKEQVIEIREECLARLEQLCVELGLEYRIVVGNGCYQVKEGEYGVPQTVEEIPIKDLEIYCPDSHDKDGGRFLEVAGSAVLASIMTSRFGIKGQNGDYLWSGCTGIGLERMMYALVTNYGMDFEGFPDKLKKAIE